MAGHSKWANIQHRKGRQDAKRGKVFTKHIRAITVTARQGGADPNTNPHLRLALDKALAVNMSKDTIERAIKRGAGGLEGANVEEVRYEGYGPAGVAIMLDCLTDNRNRTVADVRHIFSKYDGNLGTEGSVAYLFSKIGIISFVKGINEDAVMEIALESGADDIENNSDGSIDVITSADKLTAIKNTLDKAGLVCSQAEVTMQAATEVDVDNKDTAEKILRLYDALDDLDDVQNVYMNANISDKVLKTLAK